MRLEYKKYICKIFCDGFEKGTGFLVNSGTIITASHVVDGASNVIAKFFEIDNSVLECSCKRMKEECDYDVEILLLDRKIDILNFFQVSAEYVSVGKEWFTYGYAGETSPQIAALSGIITNVHDKVNPCDYNVDIDVQNGKLNDYSGLSGAPLIIDDMVQGILIHQNGAVIKAIEFSRVKDYIEANNISIYSENQDNISNVKLIDSQVIENLEMRKKLNAIILSNSSGRIILQGSIGIGKSTFVQHYNSFDTILILGKYFIKVPNDKTPMIYRLSPDVFYEWIIEKISSYIKVRSIDTEKLSYIKKIEYLASLSTQLSNDLQKNNKKALFFLDGIDELVNFGQEKIENFISYITIINSDNIFFVITSNNYEKLSESLLQTINLENNILRFNLYDKQEIKAFLYEMLDEKLSETQLEQLSEKSKGHPLYLKYIINYLNSEKENNLEQYIGELPSYSGDIKTYYEFIWRKISKNSSQVCIVSYLARIRISIRKDIFRKLLPNEFKLEFENTFKELTYLFLNNDDGNIDFFHSSFADFVNDKTNYMSCEIHHKIGEYCLKNYNDDFAVTNMLYHLANGEDEDINKSITECNQRLVDRCTILNINPDILIYDIKNELKLACDGGEYTSVIRLLLLLERIDFRYNEMFINFAFEIAKAEISFNRPDKAMQYIIRKNNIVLSMDEVLYCLEMFVEGKYFKQAKIIVMKFESLLFEYLEENNGIPAGIIGSLLQAYNMYACFDINFVSNRIIRIIKILSDSEIDDKNNTLNNIISSAFAYKLWKSGNYITIEAAEKNKFQMNKDTLSLYILLLCNTLDMENTYHKRYIDNYIDITKDIESMIGKIELEYKQLAVECLITESKNYNLVEKLINNCDYYKEDSDLRDNNGVDISIEKFKSFFGYYRNRGYMLEKKAEAIDMHVNIFRDNWEEGIKRLIKIVALTYGKALYYKANSNYSNIEDDYKYLKDVLENWLFDFDLRTKFIYSYNIPEQLFPILFKYITEYMIEFQKDKIDEYIDYIKNKSLNQFGIYLEGYIDTLFEIAYAMLKYNIDTLFVKKVTDIILHEVKNKVMNRWEKTPNLLNIIEIYNLIGCSEVAKDVYCEMLKTSMGPTWYKEDQLSLLSEAIKPIESKYITNDLLKRNFILLDSAAGGMTFERYIRVEKERLIGVLWNKGLYDIAFNYLKVQIYPNIKEINCNIQVENVDANEYGLKSYRIANTIFLDSVVLEIIEGVKSEEDALIWCFTEIFMFGDERYLNDYIRIQSQVINKLNRISSNNLDKYIYRIMTILLCDCDEEKLYKFIRLYKCYLENDVFEIIIRKLSNILTLDTAEIISKSNGARLIYNNSDLQDKAEINLEEDKKDINDSDLYLEGTFGKLSIFKECRNNISEGDREVLKGNRSNAIKKFVSVLLDIRFNGWDIWKENSSKESIECFEKIVEQCDNEKSSVKALEPVIVSDNYCRYWTIANRLYNLTANKCDSKEKNNVISELFSHLETIVNPDDKYSIKYNEIDKWDKSSDEYEVLLDIFLWLGWYPDSFISEKVFDLLPWLIESDSKYIKYIIELCFSDDVNISETCATLCLYFSNYQCDELWKLINNYDVLGKIINNKTFIVKSSFLQIYRNYNYSYSDAGMYVETIERYFKADVINSENCTEHSNINDKLIKYIDKKHIINKLINIDEGLDDLIADISNEIKLQIQPIKIDEFYKLNEALCKSFRKKEVYFGYAHDYFYTILNKVLVNLLSFDKSINIANCIRRINPYFPTPKVESYECYLKEVKIKELLYNNQLLKYDNLISETLKDKGNIMLYYTNYSYKNKLINNINITSFIVPRNDKVKEYMSRIFKYKKLYSNQYIDMHQQNKNTEVICTVNSFEPQIVKGRTIMNVEINKKFQDSIMAKKNDFKIDRWNSGRAWHESCGFPTNEGCQVMIKGQKCINIPKDKKLIYNIFDNNKNIIIDMDTYEIIDMSEFLK